MACDRHRAGYFHALSHSPMGRTSFLNWQQGNELVKCKHRVVVS